MKNFDSRVYSLNDFLEWDKNQQLELNPRFQRRSVWTDNARSYLMDTIVRGKPIPKVFIRQKLNASTRASIREVVDGQQRLRTILGYVKDGFQISKRHNEQYGGLYFSQLSQVDPDIQGAILNYEISVDLLVNMPDSEVLDVFGRLNSYAVILNEQEKINANHFGPFKTMVDDLGHIYYDFWLDNRILTEMQVLRMGDATLVADLCIAMIEGIKSKKQIKGFYSAYERDFPHDTDLLTMRFREVIDVIAKIFGASLRFSECRRIHIFYSLFTAIYHARFGIPGLDAPQTAMLDNQLDRVRAQLEVVDGIFAVTDIADLDTLQRQFLEDSRRATTDAKVRVRRTKYLLSLMTVRR